MERAGEAVMVRATILARLTANSGNCNSHLKGAKLGQGEHQNVSPRARFVYMHVVHPHLWISLFCIGGFISASLSKGERL